MNFNRTFAIVLRYFYLLRGRPQRTFQIFIWSTVDIVLWGFITKYLGSLGVGELNFTTVLLGALIFWQLITRVQQGFITVYLEDVWSRNVLNLFASPMKISEYLTGITLTTFATSALAVTFGTALAMFLFGVSLPPIGLPLIALVLILVGFGTSLGILSACLILRFGPSAEWFAWPVPALMQPFVGVFYPIAVLPVWMQWVAHTLPPSYVFEGLRSLFAGGTIEPRFLLIGLVLTGIYLFIAGAIFMLTFRWAVRSGAIARFSAENVG